MSIWYKYYINNGRCVYSVVVGKIDKKYLYLAPSFDIVFDNILAVVTYMLLTYRVYWKDESLFLHTGHLMNIKLVVAQYMIVVFSYWSDYLL